MAANIYYPILILLLFVVEEIYFLIAKRCHIIDRPIERSSHHKPTICGGGIIFWVSVLFYLSMNAGQWGEYGLFFVALTLIGGISFIDDVREVGMLPRLFIHFASLGLLLAQWGLTESAPWWYMLIVIVFGTGTINAYNFMDGVNGMTAGYSAVILVLLAYINEYVLPEPFVEEGLLHSVMLAVLVFSYYNFRNHPRCFAGDVGAVSIAFIIIFLLGKLILQTGNYTYLTFLTVYGVDSVLTIVHRIILHENIAQPHRMHLYQMLANEGGWKHTSVSALYATLQAVIGIGLLVIPTAWGYYYFTIVLTVLCIAYVILVRKYFPLQKLK